MRTGLFALVSLTLAAAAHRAAGGVAPGAVTLAVAGAALLMLGWPLSARERSGGQLAALVLGSQAVLHVGFVAAPLLMARAAGGRSAASLAALLFCHHGSHPISTAQLRAAVADLGIRYQPTPGDAPAISVGGVAMLAAHVAAAAVVAWWLRRGERAAWEAARRIMCRLQPAMPVAVRPAAPAAWAARWTVVPARWGGRLPGRGPPALRSCVST